MLARRLLLAGGGASFVVPPSQNRDALFNGQNGDGVYAIGEAHFNGAFWTEEVGPVIEASGSDWVSDHVKDPWLIDTLTAYVSGYDGTAYQVGRVTRASTIAPWAYDDDTTPNVPLGGSGDPDEDGVAFPTVLHEPSDTGREWKMWYRGEDSAGVLTVCYAWSTDGEAWTKVGMVIDVGAGGTWNDEGVLPASVVKDGATYYLFVGGRQGTTNPKWQGGLWTFTDPEGTYTAEGGNPTLLARFNDLGTSVVPTADVTTGQTTVNLADTSPFNVGEAVVVVDGDTTAEVFYIDSITSGTQLQLDHPASGNFTGGGKVFRSFAYNAVIARSVLPVSGGYEMFGTPFQPVEDLTQPASKLWEGSLRWTSATLGGTWAYDYDAGLLFPLTPSGAAWHSRSAENPSVIVAP